MSPNLKCNVKYNMDETSNLQYKMGTIPATYYTKYGRDQQPIYEMEHKTTMVMMKKNPVGDDNMFTSAMLLTLFAEATRMSLTYYFSFSPKLLRKEYKHFNYINQILIPTCGDSFQSVLLC